VLEAVASAAGWGRELPDGQGLGIAFVRYENTGAYLATIAEVGVDRASGAVDVRHLWVAHDCGLVINPDGLTNQVVGNVVQSLSRTLLEEVHWVGGGITSRDWEAYPILRFSQVPPIDVVLIDRPDQPAVGAGEPATVTTAPAVANAIAAATGARLREAPFTPERVLCALAETS
jgi:nicotinate dehydrogenase subunit B